MNKILTCTFLMLVIETSYSITNGFMNQKAFADLCAGMIACSAIAFKIDRKICLNGKVLL